MICRYCSGAVPDGSVYCNHCGQRLARKSRQSQAKRYPKPRTLADGSLLGQLMVDGSRATVKAASEEEYRARIDALRAGVLELKKHPDRRPLKDVVRAYIDKNDGVLSPATIRGYEIIYDNRFPAYRETPICRIDFQQMINDEAKTKSPKSVANAWGLVSSAMRSAGIPVPDVNLPQIPPSDEDFLDFEQIQTFLKAIYGSPAECAMLLMLHGLRTSEVLAVDAGKDIVQGPDGKQILVRGAIVQNKDNDLVEKKTNKNRLSNRAVTIMIPRLEEVLPSSGKAVTCTAASVRARMATACRHAGLPVVSAHDLRRSFASLAFHLGWPEHLIMEMGGWSNPQTVHRIYLKLARTDVRAAVTSMRNYYAAASKAPAESAAPAKSQ